MKKLFLISAIVLLVGCTDSKKNDSGITSSGAVGGEASTMEECKDRLDKTAKKYNVTYTVTIDKSDYFSGKIIKNGIQSDLILVCDKKNDYYEAIFEVPN